MKKKGNAKFAVEKSAAEGLPPGWTKELRVKKKGGKTRKDPYYIDPKSGQVFRSLKEVYRYLETKDCSKSPPELKAQGSSNMEAGGSLSSLPSEAEEQKVGESKADVVLAGNERLKLGKEQIIKPNDTECYTSPKGNTSPQCEKGAVEENNFVLKQVDDKDSDPGECQHVSAHTARENEQVLPPGKEVEKHGHKIIHKKRNKNGASLPRRNSKRIAGIKADACLELKTNNEGSVAAAKQKGQTKAVVTDNSKAKLIEKKEEATTSPMGELHSLDGNGGESSVKDDMWMDPCIEFAIKTLTGGIPIRDENKVEETSQSSLSSSAGNQQPCVDIWADPCIAFAVKMLTGEIPITDAQKQCSSAGF